MTSLLGAAFRPTAKAPVPYTGKRAGGSMFGAGSRASTGPLARMGQVGTLFAIVNRTSTATAAPDWTLYRKPVDGRPVQDGQREAVTLHAAAALWANPNPFMTQADVIETGQQHVDLTGETYLLVVRAVGIPIELWPVRPDRMTPVPSVRDFLAGWVYTSPDGDKIPLKVEDVIQIKMPNPEDPYRGMGPVQAILTDLDASTAAAAWNAAFFTNSAEPGGIVEIDRRLGDDEFDEMRQRWAEQHRGVSNAHRVAMLENGAKWVERKYTMRDMQFAELRGVSRDVIMEAYGMSRATLGITDGVNFAAAKAADMQFAKLLTVPRLERWKQALNSRLLPMFGEPGKGVEFDYDSPVEGDAAEDNAERQSRATAAQTLIAANFDRAATLSWAGLPDTLLGLDKPDPDRDLLTKLVIGAPSLAPIILPMLGFVLPAVEPAPAPAPAPGPANTLPQPKATAHDVGLCEHAYPGGPACDVRAEDEPPDADLSGHQAAWETALTRLLSQWNTITVAQRADLARQITAAIDDGDLAALAALTADSDLGAIRLREALEALAADAAADVVAEAAAQGVTIPAVIPPPAELEAVATTVAALLAGGLALSAGREALRIYLPGMTGDQVASQVDTFLRDLSDRAERDALGGALTGAQNRGRIETYRGSWSDEERSGPVGSIYADETLDENTCAPCREISGRFICTTEDLGPLDRLYTPMGGYVGCLGGVRCRGTVTGVWRPATTTGDGS